MTNSIEAANRPLPEGYKMYRVEIIRTGFGKQVTCVAAPSKNCAFDAALSELDLENSWVADGDFYTRGWEISINRD